MKYRDDEFDERSFIQQHKVGIVIVTLLAATGIGYAVKAKGDGKAHHKAPDASLVTVNLPPPPPPPPPPPAPPEPKMEQPEEQDMIAQEPVAEDEAPPEPEATEAPSTGIVGDGPPDGFGLKAGSGSRFGSGGGGGRRGSRWGWYAGQVQTTIADALRQNPKTRVAAMTVEAKIWTDRGGRVTRAQLARTTGDPGLDEAIRSDVLVGLQLREPPPADMPMPIHLRLSARRTN
jgi:outer membrane biosynthesis protein TonB